MTMLFVAALLGTLGVFIVGLLGSSTTKVGRPFSSGATSSAGRPSHRQLHCKVCDYTQAAPCDQKVSALRCPHCAVKLEVVARHSGKLERPTLTTICHPDDMEQDGRTTPWASEVGGDYSLI